MSSSLECGRGCGRENALVKFIAWLGRLLCAGLFIRIGPHQPDFEILTDAEAKGESTPG